MKNNRKGFTLIELLAVIVILAILVTLTVPALTKYIESSRKNTFYINTERILDQIRLDVVQHPTITEKTYTLLQINELLESNKRLVKSSYGNNYDPTSYIKVTYTNNQPTFEICIVDSKGNGIFNKATSKSSDVQNDIDTDLYCGIDSFTYSREYVSGTNYERIEVPKNGYYKVELWGAQGGDYSILSNTTGGYGTYTSGILYLDNSNFYYTYIGRKASSITGGYNGGGNGGSYSSDRYYEYIGGGGSTDLRVFNSEPSATTLVNNSSDGILARIMVAGGGGGAAYYGNGGNGQTATNPSSTSFQGANSSQGSGGGGGYYGGTAGAINRPGGGGSSYALQNGSIRNIEMTGGINTGNGKIKVTYIAKNLDILDKLLIKEFPKNYVYNGSYQKIDIPKDGYYKVELWGAQGGDYSILSNTTGGYGSYTKGIINFTTSDIYYVYIGSAGQCTTGGYNGGATGGYYTADRTYTFCGGGGATDLRKFSSNPSNSVLVNTSTDGITSRIMVAAGGGGSAYSGNGGAGQTNTQPTNTLFYGTFSAYSGGGGGGYYGGTAAGTNYGGGGGSSYILDDQSITNTEMTGGINTGNGKATITYIGTSLN